MELESVFITVDQYKRLAKLFRFQGDTISKLCLHNSKVAKEEGLEDLSLSWDSLNQLYKESIGSRQNNQQNEKQQRNISGNWYNFNKPSVMTFNQPSLSKHVTKDHEVSF